MTGITLQGFGGIAPKLAPKQLADNMAKAAVDGRLDRGRIEPWRGVLDVDAAVTGVQSIFKYLGTWETSTDNQSVVESITPNDTLDRLYLTDSVYPKIRSGASVYRLGLPAPPTAPTFVIGDFGDTGDPLLTVSMSYVTTIVDAWGAEGPPSDPSASTELGPGFSVTVTVPGVPTHPSGGSNWNLGVGALTRIYRSNTGTSGSGYQFLADIAYGTPTYVDTIASDDLQEYLPSATWIAPPDDDATLNPDGPLQGLIDLPGGILAGFAGNTVCVSEPYLPNAWPLAGRFTTSADVVGIAAVASGVLVVTEDRPYLLSGYSSEAMVITALESPQSCVSGESLVDMGGVAVYASPDGLVLSDGREIQVVSSEWIRREEWQASFDPTTIRAALYEGLYVAFYGDAADGTGFVFNPQAAAKGLMPITGKVECFYRDALTDQLFVGYNSTGTTWRVGEFNAGTDNTFSWASKEFMTPRPLGFTWARVQADGYPVTMTVTADGVLRDTITVSSDAGFRLRGGYKAKQWELSVSGVYAIDFAGVWERGGEVV